MLIRQVKASNIGQVQKYQKYVEGLCWVMRYYYQGVCSWLWFYPYHYAPFASDLKGLVDLEITFFPGQPFKPFDQLMGTLPAASSNALPKLYGKLMTNPDSPLKTFYPKGCCKLPFIHERLLLSETKKLEETLIDEEKARNTKMFDILYVYERHPLAALAASLYHLYAQLHMHGQLCCIPVDATLSGGMNGFLSLCERNYFNRSVSSPVEGLSSIENNRVLNVTFFNPQPHRHIPEPPEGVVMLAKTVRPQDVMPFPVLWHEDNRRHQARERPQASGAISGLTLGEAAHRLVRNSLQIKFSHSTGALDTQNRNYPYMFNQSGSAGALGYERGFQDNSNYPQYSSTNPRAYSNSGQNLRIQERLNPQDQYHNIQMGISKWTVDDGASSRTYSKTRSSSVWCPTTIYAATGLDQ